MGNEHSEHNKHEAWRNEWPEDCVKIREEMESIIGTHGKWEVYPGGGYGCRSSAVTCARGPNEEPYCEFRRPRGGFVRVFGDESNYEADTFSDAFAKAHANESLKWREAFPDIREEWEDKNKTADGDSAPGPNIEDCDNKATLAVKYETMDDALRRLRKKYKSLIPEGLISSTPREPAPKPDPPRIPEDVLCAVRDVLGDVPTRPGEHWSSVLDVLVSEGIEIEMTHSTIGRQWKAVASLTGRPQDAFVSLAADWHTDPKVALEATLRIIDDMHAAIHRRNDARKPPPPLKYESREYDAPESPPVIGPGDGGW